MNGNHGRQISFFKVLPQFRRVCIGHDPDKGTIAQTIHHYIIRITIRSKRNPVTAKSTIPKCPKNHDEDDGKQNTEYDRTWIAENGFITRACDGPKGPGLAILSWH